MRRKRGIATVPLLSGFFVLFIAYHVYGAGYEGDTKVEFFFLLINRFLDYYYCYYVCMFACVIISSCVY